MADGQLTADQQLAAAIQAINSGNAKLEWRTVGSDEGSSLAQVLVGSDGTVFNDVQAKDLGGGNVQLVTSAPAGTGGNNPYVGITTSVNPSTGTVAPLTSNNQVAIDYNPSKDNSILGLSHDQLMAGAIAGMGAPLLSGAIGAATGLTGVSLSGATGAAMGGTNAALTGGNILKGALTGGALGYGGGLVQQGLTGSADALAADNIDVGGGYNPATGAGDAATAAAAAATGVTSSASTPHLFTPSGLDVTTGLPATSVTGVPTGTSSSITDTLKNLTPTQIAQLAKAGISVAGLLAGGAAVKGITSGLTSGTGTGGMLTQQDRSGVSTGSAQYSPEYYQAIQAKYNQMMPQQPRDVTTDLKSWYETKYAPKVA
jgi:hypothetical protein